MNMERRVESLGLRVIVFSKGKKPMIQNKKSTEAKKLEKHGEGTQGSLFSEEIPVWYDRRGEVCSNGLPDAKKKESRRRAY